MLAGHKIAHKALSLKKDGVFRLMVMMLALLGWLFAMGSAFVLSLDNLYGKWQLEQKSRVSIYLLPDTDFRKIEHLEKTLKRQLGVVSVEMLDQKETFELLEPYLGEAKSVPLPKILDVEVDHRLARELFDKQVKEIFPKAEIDDAQELLDTVSQAVRFAQSSIFAAAVAILIVLVILTILTVRAGIRAQHYVLGIMQYMGAGDKFISRLVTTQVVAMAGMGYAFAVVLASTSLFLIVQSFPMAAVYVDTVVWVAIGMAPLVLFIVAALVAPWATKTVIR